MGIKVTVTLLVPYFVSNDFFYKKIRTSLVTYGTHIILRKFKYSSNNTKAVMKIYLFLQFIHCPMTDHLFMNVSKQERRTEET